MVPKAAEPLQKILLLDDEPSVLTALKLLLQALGFKPTPFANPFEAVESLKNDGDFDIILCDLRMPKMNGLEVLNEAHKLRPELPFVLMSAHATQTEVNQAIQLGAKGFLGKPFTPQQLRDLIQKLSHERSEARESA